jgi:hypothetical protein
VQQQLSEKANGSKALAMAAYMKTEMPFYGVQKPDRLPIYRETVTVPAAQSARL